MTDSFPSRPRRPYTPVLAVAVPLALLLGCTPICSDCSRIHELQRKQLDYLPTPPAKQDRTIWTGEEIPRRVETRLVLEPIQWIEPQTFDADGSWTI